LLRAEIREDLQKTKEGALLFVLAALVAMPGVLMLCFTVVYVLNRFAPGLELWLCFLIVALVLCATSAALVYGGVKKFQSFSPLPEKSLTALKENLLWRKNPM
jgi:hypothetical protein